MKPTKRNARRVTTKIILFHEGKNKHFVDVEFHSRLPSTIPRSTNHIGCDATPRIPVNINTTLFAWTTNTPQIILGFVFDELVPHSKLGSILDRPTH